MRRTRVGLVLVAAACLGVALVGCGGDDDDETIGGTTPAAATTETGRPTAALDSETGLTVVAKDFSFALNKSSVKKGSQVDVAFENQGSAPHTINFYTDEAYTKPIADAESGRVSGGGSKAFTFSAPDGTVAYFRCEVHPAQMQGEITLN